MIERLKSIYYVLTKNYKLLLSDKPFPKGKTLGCLILHEDSISVPDIWHSHVPEEVINRLKEAVETLEGRNLINRVNSYIDSVGEKENAKN